MVVVGAGFVRPQTPPSCRYLPAPAIPPGFMPLRPACSYLPPPKKLWWLRLGLLGRGASCTVWTASGVIGGKPTPIMAVKSAPLRSVSDPHPFRREEDIMKDLDGKYVRLHNRHCPYIVRCYGHDITDENPYRGDGGLPSYNLFFEMAPRGDLAATLSGLGGAGIDEHRVRRFTKTLLLALLYVHQSGYVHCDVKPDNILLFDDDTVKLADFGLALKMWTEKPVSNFRGTLPYIAPESITHGEYTPAADVYSLGCTVVELITGNLARRSLGRGVDTEEYMSHIADGSWLPKIPGEDDGVVSGEGRDFMLRCLEEDPDERWTVEMLLEHAFAKV